MEGKPYPEAKRRILIELSTAEFIKFLEEVTDQEGRLFIQNQLLQRRVPGFRDGRAPFTRTVPQLITQLKSEQELANPNSTIWNSFANVWMYWVKSHQELDNTLTAFDNGLDFDENHNCITPPNSELDIECFKFFDVNSELDIECFKFLLEASRSIPLHQEMIRRFYEFGYFNEDEHIQNLINQVPPYDEIERREQLEMFRDRVGELSQNIDRLFQNIEDLNMQVSAVENVNESEQRLAQLIAEERQYFDTQLQEFRQTILENHELHSTQFSGIESYIRAHSTRLDDLVNRVNLLESKLSKLQEPINSLKNRLTEIQSLNRQAISQLINQRVQDGIEQFDSRITAEIGDMAKRFDATEVAVSEIQSEITGRSRVSTQALEYGERFRTELERNIERYKDETEYLDHFCHYLRRFGIVDSGDEEMATAIHIALKAFPAVEIADARIMRAWSLTCDNHFKLPTTINVEMGWLGLQDWFPDLFARQCFGERLEPVELKASIEKMLELGDMLWAIYFRYCDRSFPESYLPGFLDWINHFCYNGIRTLLIRCSGNNYCETNEDFYERIARLPKPKNHEPIESRNLRPSKIPLTLSEWHSWCQSNLDIDNQYNTHYNRLEEIRSAVENRGKQIPRVLLREIQHYLRLSHNIMAKSHAFDWALTLRFLPWIENQPKAIDSVLGILDQENNDLQHFYEGLQQARESINESN